MALLWHLKSAHTSCAEQAEVSSKCSLSMDHLPFLQFRMWSALALGGAIPPPSLLPFWLPQALSNWLTLGFARSSTHWAASPWLHWITWNSSLGNNTLKGLQHFCTAPQFFSTFLESFVASSCSLPWWALQPVQYPLSSPSFPFTCISTQANHMAALNQGFLISFLFLNHKTILPFSEVRFPILHLNYSIIYQASSYLIK